MAPGDDVRWIMDNSYRNLPGKSLRRTYFRSRMTTNYLDNLNEAQHNAVTHMHGPMMVIAGAGSGKTRVLTVRIAHLINQGIDAFDILALTFTNKAAKEMKARIAHIIGEQESKNIWMGTFHSIFARILRIESEKINYPRNFSIYDTADTKGLIRDIIKEMGLDDKIYKPGLVQNRISSCKNNLVSAEDYRQDVDLINEDNQSGKFKMVDIYATYDQRLLKASAMDFDDLLFKTNLLLRDHVDVLHKYQHRFKFILVDEYQDTNFSQYMIIKQLGAVHENVCVVGDDAQSIYAFRGANIQNMLNFRKDYRDYALFKLEQNYRSTRTIVNAANSVIERNKDRIEKDVWTANAEGDRIRVYRSTTDNDEGMFVANQILATHREHGETFDRFAILYRTNAQSRAFEESLRKLNIPYRIYGGTSFYQRKEIKDLLAYFRLTANHNDEESLKRIINYPARGIGKATLDRLFVAANERNVSIWEMIPASHELGIGASAYQKLQDFGMMIRNFAVELETRNAYDMAHQIADNSGLLKDLYSDRTPEGVARYDNLQELLNGIREFSDRENPLAPEIVNTLSDFLVDVALLTDADNIDKGEKEKISLMTIHASKGLEFSYVNIVGLEENLFPSQLALNSREELEEERRLFYVALTRAEKGITLSYSQTRYRWGQLSYCEPSRFIEEIDQQYLELPAPERTASPKPSGIDFRVARASFGGRQSAQPIEPDLPEPKSPPTHFKPLTAVSSKLATSGDGNYANPADIFVGAEVLHEKFGKGKVVQLEGTLPDVKAIIFFPAAGQKQLLLKFAKLTLLGAQ